MLLSWNFIHHGFVKPGIDILGSAQFLIEMSGFFKADAMQSLA